MRSSSLVMTLIGLAGLGLAGCVSRSVAEDSVVDHFAQAEDELDFWDSMQTRRVVTNNDALHGLLLVNGAGESYDTYQSRLDEAVERGWTTGETELPRDESVRLGIVSMAVCDMLDVDGGLTMRMIGPQPRYCTRELVYMGIIPDRTEDQSLSGLEFMDLIRKVGDRLRGGGEEMLDRAITGTLESHGEGTDERPETNETEAGAASGPGDASGEGPS